MMNLSFLGLPDWMPHIETIDDASLFVALVREHHDRVRSIDEDRSEGYALLQLYRDFLSGNYTAPFFAFLGSYSSYLMSAINRSNYFVKPFSETNLRRLFEMTEPKLTPILENEGFRSIAYAIRMSTIVPLYRGKSASYETRFGLGQELLRHAQYNNEFVQALSKFIHAYNDETTRVQRRTGKQFRSLVTMDAVEKIVQLIDEYDSKTICNLLVAFGYARDQRAKEGVEAEEILQEIDSEATV
ncbi:MAG: hypothetical protein KDD84_00275, partial [Caldilineaceae bacterium]|nr:hypothetical protein [Caldilineaceae bacterium]